MYTCNKKLHFSRTSVPDLISIKRPVVNGQITVQNWSISATEAFAEAKNKAGADSKAFTQNLDYGFAPQRQNANRFSEY